MKPILYIKISANCIKGPLWISSDMGSLGKKLLYAHMKTYKSDIIFKKTSMFKNPSPILSTSTTKYLNKGHSLLTQASFYEWII